jgi:hypothetical protein
MDTQTLWMIVLSVATPVAGVVGFAIQLRQVKSARLKNEKLKLEIAALQQRAQEAERRIVIPTNTEVQKITRGEVLFSRQREGASEVFVKPKTTLKEHFIVAVVLALVGLIVVYLVYDLYRFAALVREWL